MPMPRNLTFDAVPSWYWQRTDAWENGHAYYAGDLVHRDGLEFDRYVCLRDHRASLANAPRDSDNGFWRIEYEERVPLNTEFVDNGVYLTARDDDGNVIDLSTQVRRHGLVNTNKAGHYILTYYCKYLNFYWEGIKRKVVVCEPDWMENTVPQIFLEYPAFRQTLQNYLDLYYELNYLSDNVRLGLGVSKVTCDKYTKHWARPEGVIDGYSGDDGYFTVRGYTFRDGDKVLVQSLEDPDTWNKYYVQMVKTEADWRIEGNPKLAEEGCYDAGDWVRFLDKIYVCKDYHKVTQDVKKIKPRIIYPVVKKTDKEGDVIAVRSEYWDAGCRIALVRYGLGAHRKNKYQREIDWEFNPDGLIGAAIRRFRPVVDAQGYLFEYEYEPKPLDEEEYYTRYVDLTPYLDEVLADENYDRQRYLQTIHALPSGVFP